MHKGFLLAVCAVLLSASLTSNVNGYWPIVFQIANEGRAYESVNGPLRFMNGGIGVDPNSTSAETSAAYKFTFQEFNSFRDDTLKAIEVYLQIYPSDVHSSEYGKTGFVWFNGEMVKKFNMTTKLNMTQQSYNETFFFDESSLGLGQAKLSFPIPLYDYFSPESLFIRIPEQLLGTSISVTLNMDAGVLWKIYIISVIVRVLPDAIAPWWRQNMQVILGITIVEVTSLAFISVKLRQRLKRRGVIN